MPFDALAMRAMEARWQRLVGGVAIRLAVANDRLWLTVKRADGETEQLLIVLKPGMQRLHRTQEAPKKAAQRPPFPWLARLVPFTIRRIAVPPFERIMHIGIERPDDWGQPIEETLVVELAGHLTNLILLNDQGLVKEAWRKIPPGRPGRMVWPTKLYEPPPPLKNPLVTGDPRDLPPWARRWLEDGGHWETLREDYLAGFPQTGFRLFNRQTDEVWVYPQPGFEAKPATDFEAALDEVFRERERRLAENNLKAQLISQWQSRRTHLREKIAEYQVAREQTGEFEKQLGDLWLTYQHAFTADPQLLQLDVAGFDGQPVQLCREPGESPADRARAHYRRYKKIKARHEALERLIPALEIEVETLNRLLMEAEKPHPMSWFQSHLKKAAERRRQDNDREPFRRFVSLHGLEIWVGRNREENAKLTFQKARPDDIWLHTKQAPGSHVVLFSGKKTPDLEDLLDAAELAVFFSSAQGSSTVPVDYTRRKFVRKRPHAEPGQVLYQREKTLYITPNTDRLRRLGAVSEKLVDDR
ncbi:Rqc2 family fibronectin-binding protein [Sulfobacillus harzensis]|uniref:DUF814 domain-containing protein n=1 Tax=Sulfobacillus harzensis TaxID=2729629 RepID=A0A7Y0L1P6_9FIRM|nr:NFACT RNA binding domain-containing protein [Sulfobacillus harzensis]NMP21653.1 DUF814 domain-containing protein [Sulfobacillus harzensis]